MPSITKKKSAAAVGRLEEIPNIGPSLAGDLRRIGIREPADLRGREPYALYQALCETTGIRQDPCVMDAFTAAVYFMRGKRARPWWLYTAERKRKYPDL